MVQKRVHHRSKPGHRTLSVDTESLCPDHGGVSVKSKCKQCRKEYLRRYRQKNREKVLEQRRRHYRENREKVLEQQRRYRQENREKIAERERRYRRENREKIAEYKRRYNQENWDYISGKNTERDATKNRTSQYFATNSHKPWTPQEVAKMHRLRRQGLTNYEVAVELGRSLKSVKHRITQENARN